MGSPHRGRIEIYAQMLSIAQIEMLKTHLYHKMGNLIYTNFRKRLKELEALGLIESSNPGRSENGYQNKGKWQTTAKGLTYLKLYEELRKFLDT